MTTDDGSIRLGAASATATDGTFVVEISIGEDRAWALTADQARAHAAAFAAAATIAEHETAVVELIRRRGVDMPTIASLLAHQIRPRRPFDPTSTAPLRLHGAVGTRGPFVEIHLDDTRIGSMSPAGCLSHATNVLRVVTAVALDQVMHQVLTGDLEMPDDAARAFIADLPTTWPGAQTTP